MSGNRLRSLLRVCVMLCVGLWKKKKNKCMDVKKKPFRFDQNKSCQTAKEGGWHIFHSVHGCQQWWFIREEKKKEKKTAEEVTYMVRENERERSAGSGFYLWFIYVPLSGFLPPNPHWRFTLNERDVPNRQKCFSLLLSRDVASRLGQAGRRLFLPVILSQWICWYICTVHMTNTPSC